MEFYNNRDEVFCSKHGQSVSTNCKECASNQFHEFKRHQEFKDNLISYLRNEFNQGKREFRISLNPNDGIFNTITGIVHPLNKDGETLDIKF